MRLARDDDTLYRIPLGLHLTLSFCAQSLSKITPSADQFFGGPSENNFQLQSVTGEWKIKCDGKQP